ncbi:hypothetical protein SAMN06265173_1485 [Thalassovita litoralis]|uniref:Uncharacterized protein n=1 Tax=Thalassovita litoralis TaxID=1010611 RepID=A0A521FRV6_9RHOB|nr:hypothetical protein [Thalassovita litoralis]SMO98938.1 hypothetical protein SAMN06265173_1485 [Thalassovita litoralis]
MSKEFKIRMSADGAELVKRDFVDVGQTGKAALMGISQANKDARKSAAVFDAMIDEQQKSFQNLRASLDPTFASMMKFQRIQEQVNQAMQAGIATQDEAQDIMALARRQIGDFDGALRGAGTAADSSTYIYKNLAYQLNQVGQQGAVTGDFVGALAIQIPDILAGFGSLSLVVAGGAAALGAAFLPALMDTTEESKKAKEQIKAVAEAIGGVEDMTRDATEQLKLMQTGLRTVQELRVQDEIDRLTAERNRLKSQIAGNVAPGPVLNVMRQETKEIQAQVDALEEKISKLREANDALEDARIQKEIDAGFMAVAQAQTTLNAQTSAYIDDMAVVFQTTRDLREELGDAAFEALRLSGVDLEKGVDAAAKAAARLAGDLGVSLQAAYGIIYARNQTLSRQAGGRGGDPRRFDSDGRFSNVRDFVPTRETIQAANKIMNPGGGRGGGQSEAEKAHNKLLREAERIYEETRTAAERYADELEQLEEIRKLGGKYEEAYQRAIKQTREEYLGTAEAARYFSDELGNGLIDAIMQAKDLDDVMRDLTASIARAVLQATLLGDGPLSGIFGTKESGGLLGSIFKSFDGGGYTGAGSRTGGLDGKGGFMAMLHPNETVIDHAKGISAASSGRVEVVARVENGNIVQTIESVSGRVAAHISDARIRQYDRHELPSSVKRINDDPYAVGA